MKRLLLCVLLVGCSDDDSGGGGPVALDNFGMELATVSCRQQFDCCTDAEIMDMYMGITYDGHAIMTEADCVGFANALLTGLGVAQWKESLAMGRIEYDSAAAGGCISALEGLTCDQYSSGNIDDLPSSCRPYLIPKVGDGGGCTQDYECTSKNCVGATHQPNGPDTDGMCQPMPGAGEACTDNCADGLYCGFDTTNGNELCMPLKTDGAECSLDRDCASEYCDDTSRKCATEPPTCTGQ
ncbi:MAG: hypothetical protein HOV81_41945 [Kofleriaceae bacterium]|nr:hypothetical protein [Kofleriaceae bacterium]